jgi:hypothetical protein
MRAVVVLTALAVAVFATACSSGAPTIRREPPALQLETLRLDDSRARIGLLLHNRNDHPIEVRALRLGVTVEGESLIDDRWSLALRIGPRVRERVPLETVADAAGARRLDALDSSPATSIAYRLFAEIDLAEQTSAERQSDGFLHPVPGQPGSFR